jgi:septal ring factor EnvC (AmiA/AmiB activator)
MSDNINTSNAGIRNNEISEPPVSRFPWISAILGVGLAGALGVAAVQHSNLVNTRLEMEALKKEVSAVRQSADQTDQRLLETLQVLKADIESTKEANTATAQNVKEARMLARKQAELVASRISKQQDEQNKQMAERLDQIKSSTDQHQARLTEVSTEVGNVKTEVASTRSELDKTVSELHRMTGDMGVMSGLIATNSKELTALKELGERDYYEFTLNKKQKQQRIGDILVEVKKADLKRNRYTVEVVADDKRIEKKDKTVNEPVQFYVLSKARVPYEMVVNEVRKDTIVGYLAMPKVKSNTSARR